MRAFNDKLFGAGAPTDAEVKAALLRNSDTNTITDAQAVVLGNTSGANTGDMSDAEVRTAALNSTYDAFYTSDFSAGADSWLTSQTTVDGNIDSIAGVDDTLRIYASAVDTSHIFTRVNSTNLGKNIELTFDYYIPSANTNVDGIGLTFIGLGTLNTLDTWTTYTGSGTVSGNLDIYLLKAGVSSFAGAGSVADDLVYIKNFSLKVLDTDLMASANNAAAAVVGVKVGGLYRTDADPSVVCIRTA